MTEEPLFDTSEYGDFHIPPEIAKFLVTITDPRPGEKVLAYGLLNPTVVTPLVEDRINAAPQTVPAYPLNEELLHSDERYDVILNAPPFGRFAPEASIGARETSEEFWLRWSIGHLTPSGRLAIVVPAGLLSNYTQYSIRSDLIEEAGLKAILELPAGWAYGTLTPARILYITWNRDPSRLVHMFRFGDATSIPWDILAESVLSDRFFVPEGVSGKAYAVPAADLNALRLDPQYYDPLYTDMPLPDPEVFEEVELADLVEIRSGDRFSKKDFVTEGIPFVQVGNVTTDGKLTVDNAKMVTESVALDNRGYARRGDILVTIAGTVGKVALLDQATPETGVCIDTSLRRLRIRDTGHILPEYLSLYLRSTRAQLQMERLTSGSVIPVLSSPNLGSILVYLPGLDTQHAIISTFHDLAHQFVNRLLSVFPDAELMQNVLEKPQPAEVQQVEQVALPIPEPEPLSWKETVKARFPFPIARAYTVFEKELGQSPFSRLKALIDVSEAVVHYLYGVLASDQLRRHQISDDPKLAIVTDFSIDRRIDFVLAMLKHARQDSAIALFVPELVNAQVGVCKEINNNLRNKYSHIMGQPEPWHVKMVAEYKPKLERLLQSLTPLCDYTLAQVSNLDSRNLRLLHTIISMMGNSPYFQSELEDLDDLLADRGHVILIDRQYNVLDLHPFYILYAWQSTGYDNHLCFFKQLKGDPPNQRLLVESAHGVGDDEVESDLGLSALLTVEIG
jgi:hypothetical protein